MPWDDGDEVPDFVYDEIAAEGAAPRSWAMRRPGRPAVEDGEETVLVAVRVSAPMAKALDAEAARRGMTRSALVREALATHLLG